MKKPRNDVRVGAALAACLLAAALPAAATELALVSAGDTELSWKLAAPGGRALLAIAGDEVKLRRVIDGGRPVSLSLFDDAGQLLPDGSYNWELTEMPAAVEGRWHDPENGRDGGRPLAERPDPGAEKTQTGWFSIRDGRLVDVSVPEFELPAATRNNDAGRPERAER